MRACVFLWSVLLFCSVIWFFLSFQIQLFFSCVSFVDCHFCFCCLLSLSWLCFFSQFAVVQFVIVILVSICFLSSSCFFPSPVSFFCPVTGLQIPVSPWLCSSRTWFSVFASSVLSVLHLFWRFWPRPFGIRMRFRTPKTSKKQIPERQRVELPWWLPCFTAEGETFNWPPDGSQETHENPAFHSKNHGNVPSQQLC